VRERHCRLRSRAADRERLVLPTLSARCFSTVCTATFKKCAISLLVFPAAINRRVRCCRCVRRGARVNVLRIGSTQCDARAAAILGVRERRKLRKIPALPILPGDYLVDVVDVVDGGGFSSEIFIGTLGTAASAPRLSFTSQSGDALRLVVSQIR